MPRLGCVHPKNSLRRLFPNGMGMPVLVKWIQPKTDRKPVVLAGNIQKTLQNVAVENALQHGGEDGVFTSDPWGSWIKNQGSTGLTSQVPTVKPSGNVAPPPRKLESPIEDKFQRQEEQIHQLRTSAEKEILSLRDDMSKLEKALEDQKGVINTNMELTAQEFKTLRAETTNQFQVVTDMFKESLSSAIAAHDGAMSAQFSELKQLITSNSSRSSPLPKKMKPTDAGSDPYMAH